MTSEQFAERHNKKLKTIDDYLEKGFIQGALKIDGVWDIPEDARLPYTENRINPQSDQPSVYKSILTGVKNNRSVSHQVYGMTEEDFNGYIEVLLGAELIIKSTLSRNVPTYRITEKGVEASSVRGKN